jgi:hypothetical protein
MACPKKVVIQWWTDYGLSELYKPHTRSGRRLYAAVWYIPQYASLHLQPACTVNSVVVLLPLIVLTRSLGTGDDRTLVQDGVGGHSVLVVGAVHETM